METYVKKIMPLIEEKRNTEFAEYSVEFNDTDETYFLNKKLYLSNKLEDIIQPSSIITNNQ